MYYKNKELKISLNELLKSIKNVKIKRKLRIEYIKENKCCIDNEYKKIDTNIKGCNIGKMPICKACYIDII